MKKTLNAIEMTLPEGIRPIAMAGSGYLRALLWKSEEDCHFMICREDPDTGDIDTNFRPCDVEHVARLTAVVAQAFHQVLTGELSGDLGCLAHCLSQTLGIEFDENGIPKPTQMQ